MKKWTMPVLLCLISTEPVNSWGFFAHKTINRLAVFTLPKPLFGFFKNNIEFLTEHAVDADKRRYAAEEEAARHYLDADHYEQELPLDSIPPSWKFATEKYSKDTLLTYGILPWHIYLMSYQLTEAFKKKDKNRVLRLCADIGHYIGDCHVPLHTTKNYNGQLTGQQGIHGFWESRLPELFSSEYDFFTGKAAYLENIQETIWSSFQASVAARDSVLTFESLLNNRYPSDKKYAFEQRGNVTMKVYSADYAREYHEMLNGMVERRMRAAIITVGSIWYTCWINAGQPDIELIEAPGQNPQDTLAVTEPDDTMNNGKIIDREEGP